MIYICITCVLVNNNTKLMKFETKSFENLEYKIFESNKQILWQMELWLMFK